MAEKGYRDLVALFIFSGFGSLDDFLITNTETPHHVHPLTKLRPSPSIQTDPPQESLIAAALQDGTGEKAILGRERVDREVLVQRRDALSYWF